MAALAGACVLSGCGGSTAGSSRASDVAAVRAVAGSLFTALEHHDYATACDDYSPKDRALVIASAQQLGGPRPASCAAGLGRIIASSPPRGTRLGTPSFDRVTVNGSRATVTESVAVTSSTRRVVGRTKYTLVKIGSVWKVDKASSLRFTPQP